MIGLKENSGRSVIDRTYRRLVDDISSAKFKPGERMPGDRELAKEYGIGRSSMIRVLARLQEERYVERIPVYGTFVRNDLHSRYQVVSLAFVTPDISMSPEHIGLQSWSAVMEILRGIFEECSTRPGMRTTILYCRDTADPRKLRTQLEDLRRFDGVIFCGPLMQMLKQQYAAEGKPAVVAAAKPNVIPEIYPMVYFDSHDSLLRMAHYVMDRARKQPIVLLHWKLIEVDNRQNLNEFEAVAQELKRCGAFCEEIYIDRLIHDNAEALAVLEPLFRNRKKLDGKMIWCLNRRMLPVVNHLLQKYQLKSSLFGATASVAQGNLFPPVPYLLEPFHEMGQTAVRLLIEQIDSGERPGNRTLEPVLYCGSNPISNKKGKRRNGK
ncbi:MAG: GntR family transcriptional regulator [Lentisphaeria bacterium]|nr:GntR family transcriptional regulator [Lentisphaeria bacterium]